MSCSAVWSRHTPSVSALADELPPSQPRAAKIPPSQPGADELITYIAAWSDRNFTFSTWSLQAPSNLYYVIVVTELPPSQHGAACRASFVPVWSRRDPPSQPGADEFPTSHPGFIELPLSQPGVAEFPLSQSGATVFSASRCGAAESLRLRLEPPSSLLRSCSR